MRAEYRILHFVANPFSGLCFPVAALVRDENGEVEVVAPSYSPDPHCLGSKRAANALLARTEDITQLTSFERLPRHFGPNFVLSQPEVAPSENPHKWVRKVLFPNLPESVAKPRRKGRAIKGRRYLERHGILAERHYRPEGQGRMVQPVSLYVKHEEGLFLLEPLISRSDDDEFCEANTHLRAMHDLLEDEPAHYFTFLLSGVDPGFKVFVRDNVADFVHVVDTTDPTQERTFLDQLRPKSVLSLS